MTDYLIRWETTQEAATPREAAARAWEDLRAADSIATVFTVIDPATGLASVIDLSAPLLSPDQPPLAQLSLFTAGRASAAKAGIRTYRFVSRIDVTIAVTALDQDAAFTLLDDTAIDLRAVGDPVRRGVVTITDMALAADPELLPEPTGTDPPDTGRSHPGTEDSGSDSADDGSEE